jgi:hypothetical protein
MKCIFIINYFRVVNVNNIHFWWHVIRSCIHLSKEGVFSVTRHCSVEQKKGAWTVSPERTRSCRWQCYDYDHTGIFVRHAAGEAERGARMPAGGVPSQAIRTHGPLYSSSIRPSQQDSLLYTQFFRTHPFTISLSIHSIYCGTHLSLYLNISMSDLFLKDLLRRI